MIFDVILYVILLTSMGTILILIPEMIINCFKSKDYLFATIFTILWVFLLGLISIFVAVLL